MSLELPIKRNASCRSATEIFEGVLDDDMSQYEERVEAAFLNGDFPSWMSTFDDITIEYRDVGTYAPHALVVRMLRDYLTVGTDEDNLRVPMTPIVAQRIADACDSILPTTMLVNAAWYYTYQRIEPLPAGPPYIESVMASISHIREHNERINHWMLKQEEPFVRTRRCAGHMKDVVLTNMLKLKPNKVAIYGWQKLEGGRPIQPLFLGHSNTYFDYSHGIRLWSNSCMLDGKDDKLTRILTDPILNKKISAEGVMMVLRQP